MADADEPRPPSLIVMPPGEGGSEGPHPQPAVAGDGGAAQAPGEAVEHPAKVMRIGTMVKQLLEEVRQTSIDEPGRRRLAEIYQASIGELGEVLSEELRLELQRFALPLADESTPSEGELRVAHAQLVGWLEGLFHGIQATLFAQQMAARAQLEEIRRGLPAGDEQRGARPGTYL